MGLPFKEDTANNYYIYLIEGGDDANDGSTPALAVETMARGVYLLENAVTTKRRTLVIVKHKIIDQSIASVSRTSTKPITFLCLNRTIFEFATNNILSTVSNDRFVNMQCDYMPTTVPSITIYYDRCLMYGDGIRYFPAGTAGQHAILDRCTIKNFALLSASNSNKITNSVISDCTSYGIIASQNLWGQVINTVIYNCPNLRFFAANVNAYFNCNIVGNVLLDGVVADNDDLMVVGKNVNGISADPLFNDSANNVYTVTSASPCLYAGTNNQHIGIGEALYLDGETLLTDAIDSENIELLGTKLIRTDVDLSAFLETKIFHNGTNRIVNLIELSASLGFVADALIQSVQLEDESTIDPYVPFLTFKIKVASSEAGIATADWIVLPFNQQPLLDEAGIGNGDNTFDTSDTLQYLKLNYFKLFIGIQNLA